MAALDPHNCVRLILPEGAGDEKYANAARDLNEWLREGVLARDGEPALYRYHQTLHRRGQDGDRRGFICRIRLARFEERIVLAARAHAGGAQGRSPQAQARDARAPVAGVRALLRSRARERQAVRGHREDGAGAGRAHQRRRRAEAVAADRQGGAGRGRRRSSPSRRSTSPTATTATRRCWRCATSCARSRRTIRARRSSTARSSWRTWTIRGCSCFPRIAWCTASPAFDLAARASSAPSSSSRSRRWPAGDAAAVRAELEQRGKARPTFAIAAGDGSIYYLSLRARRQPRRRAVAQGPRGAAHARRDAAARARHRGHPRHRSRGAGEADQPALRQGHGRGAGAGARSRRCRRCS